MVVDFERIVGVGAGGAKDTWLTCLDELAKLAYVRSGITSLERLTAVKVSAAFMRCQCMVLWTYAYLQLSHCAVSELQHVKSAMHGLQHRSLAAEPRSAAGRLGTAAFRHLTL